MVNLKEAQMCPTCGCEKTVITGVDALFEDTRMETLRCPECNAIWRLYSRVSEIRGEVLSKGEVPSSEPVSLEVTETPVEVVNA